MGLGLPSFDWNVMARVYLLFCPLFGILLPKKTKNMFNFQFFYYFFLNQVIRNLKEKFDSVS